MSDYSAAVPKLLAMGLKALRQNSVLPRLVNNDFNRDEATRQGSTINITVPAAVPSRAVVPGPTAPANTVTTPTTVPLAMSNWQEAPFELSDKEMREVDRGIIPMQASEAIKSLANDVDTSIWSLYTGIYGLYGQKNAGAFVNPFSDGTTNGATGAAKVLGDQFAPVNDRRLVMNTAAEAAAKNLRAYQDASWTGDPALIIQGRLNERLGFSNWMNQNSPYHTAGTAAAATVTMISDSDVGDTSVTLKVSASTATVKIGDIITFANHSQQYTVTANATLDTSGVAVSISPALQTATDGSVTPVVTTVEPSHAVNLAFQRNAIGFASRTLLDAPPDGTAGNMMSVADPISGLVLRLEVSRQYKQTRWSFDILWGCALVRPDLAVRLAGAAA